jgi:D-alanyl-D-alanine carboxypeptidase/D-alanyl-D-alanine-endopeptidase (penicillin-binding protein 4)
LYLGSDYEFKTDLFYDGYVSNDTLYGNIYLVGGCDPDFTTTDLNVFVDAIKSLNISVIYGNLFGDVSFKDSLYWGKGWMWDDDPSSDAPYLSALNINDNCIEISYDSKEKLTTINPKSKYIDVKRIESEEELIIDRNWLERKNEINIIGRDDNKIYTAKVNVLNPELFFLKVFFEVLDSNQVKILGNLETKHFNRTEIFLTSLSRKYSDVIVNLNKESDNLSAEMTLLALSEKFYSKPANAKNGIKVLEKMIEQIGLDPKDYRLVDGSGVSHYNVVSAELLVSVLKYIFVNNPELYQILYNSFPNAGVDGTLEYRMKKTLAENNVHAKTGTLTGVSTLSGYLTTRKNHLIAFSIMMQNYIGSSSKAKELQDEICKILSEIK